MEAHGENRGMGGYGCILPFDNDDAEFSRGFEAGRLWGVLRNRPDESVEEVVHVSNAEMVLRMGEALNRAVRSEDVDRTWIAVFFDPAGVEVRT